MIELKSNPSWSGNIKYNTERRSYDYGDNYQEETIQVLFGSYYFLNERYNDTDRIAYNITAFFAYMGALSGVIIKFFRLLGSYINKNHVSMMIIKNHYLLKSRENTQIKDIGINKNLNYLSNLNVLKFFNFKEKFPYFRNLWIVKLFRNNTKNEQIYDKGFLKLNREMDIMLILKQMQKLKAYVKVLT